MRRLIPFALVLLIVLAACGSDDDAGTKPDATPTEEPAEATKEPDPPATPDPDPTPIEQTAVAPTPDPTATLTEDREPGEQGTAEIDPATLILARQQLGEGWTREEVQVDEATESTEQYCGWGEEVPGWTTNAGTAFESGSGHLLFQYVYVYPEGVAAEGLKEFRNHLANCDVWEEPTESGPVTAQVSSIPMAVLGDEAMSYRIEMTSQDGSEFIDLLFTITRYGDVLSILATSVPIDIDLGFRASEHLHAVDEHFREVLGLEKLSIGDPIGTTHGLEITPHSVSTEQGGDRFPGRTVWLIDMEACADRDGVDVSTDVTGDFNVDHSVTMPENWGGTLNADECIRGQVPLLTETSDAELRSIRYNISPAITDPFGWLEWTVED